VGHVGHMGQFTDGSDGSSSDRSLPAPKPSRRSTHGVLSCAVQKKTRLKNSRPTPARVTELVTLRVSKITQVFTDRAGMKQYGNTACKQ